jgi:hypothetical protein
LNEHSFIKSIHKHLHPDVYKWKIHDTYTGGVPDAMYSGPGGVLFVEYKYVKAFPKRDTTMIKTSVSLLQLQWLERMNTAAKAALIVGVEDSAVIITSDFVTRCANIRSQDLLAQPISRKDIAEWVSNQVLHSQD